MIALYRYFILFGSIISVNALPEWQLKSFSAESGIFFENYGALKGMKSYHQHYMEFDIEEFHAINRTYKNKLESVISLCRDITEDDRRFENRLENIRGQLDQANIRYRFVKNYFPRDGDEVFEGANSSGINLVNPTVMQFEPVIDSGRSLMLMEAEIYKLMRILHNLLKVARYGFHEAVVADNGTDYLSPTKNWVYAMESAIRLQTLIWEGILDIFELSQRNIISPHLLGNERLEEFKIHMEMGFPGLNWSAHPELIEISAGRQDSLVIFELKIPLIDSKQLQVYKPYPLGIDHEGKIANLIWPARKCVKLPEGSIREGVQLFNLSKTCEISVFMGERESSLCGTEIKYSTEVQVTFLEKSNSWLISGPTADSAILKCPFQKQQNRYVPQAAVIQLKDGCSLRIDRVKLTSTSYREICMLIPKFNISLLHSKIQILPEDPPPVRHHCVTHWLTMLFWFSALGFTGYVLRRLIRLEEYTPQVIQVEYRTVNRNKHIHQVIINPRNTKIGAKFLRPQSQPIYDIPRNLIPLTDIGRDLNADETQDLNVSGGFTEETSFP
ncbi:hypothetical protein QAD02_020702 [Eretmocerus hayati]|uniref:Uncharacterized protein n=1 Tax=Eretmocerus hayati TaxID=131215 RepID=A0ACC2PMT4_9HYME|nr:hypothetical protein QAD02_020702 [Eretmocerus hayati]